MEFRRLIFMIAVMLSWGCAAKPPPPATVAPPSAAAPAPTPPPPAAASRPSATPDTVFVDVLIDGIPPRCRPLIADLQRTLNESVCDSDEECTVVPEAWYCEAERVDLQQALKPKREALLRCLGKSELASCSARRAFCMGTSCRISSPAKPNWPSRFPVSPPPRTRPTPAPPPPPRPAASAPTPHRRAARPSRIFSAASRNTAEPFMSASPRRRSRVKQHVSVKLLRARAFGVACAT